MAKAKDADKNKKAAATSETKAPKEKREKNKGPKVIERELSVEGTKGFTRTVSHVRNVGVLVTTTTEKGVATIFINGLKPKSKNGQLFLVQDKGPKPKKDKKAKADKKG